MQKFINLLFFLIITNISAPNLVPESYWDIQSVSNLRSIHLAIQLSFQKDI